MNQGIKLDSKISRFIISWIYKLKIHTFFYLFIYQWKVCSRSKNSSRWKQEPRSYCEFKLTSECPKLIMIASKSCQFARVYISHRMVGIYWDFISACNDSIYIPWKIQLEHTTLCVRTYLHSLNYILVRILHITSRKISNLCRKTTIIINSNNQILTLEANGKNISKSKTGNENIK